MVKPGPELDRAVAEAVGFDPRTNAVGQTVIETKDAIVQFQPSIDLNAAFAAAEKVASGEMGFGDWELSTYVGRNEKGWTCQIGDCDERSFQPTPALAICAAIMSLSSDI